MPLSSRQPPPPHAAAPIPCVQVEVSLSSNRFKAHAVALALNTLDAEALPVGARALPQRLTGEGGGGVACVRFVGAACASWTDDSGAHNPAAPPHLRPQDERIERLKPILPTESELVALRHTLERAAKAQAGESPPGNSATSPPLLIQCCMATRLLPAHPGGRRTHPPITRLKPPSLPAAGCSLEEMVTVAGCSLGKADAFFVKMGDVAHLLEKLKALQFRWLGRVL